MRPFIRKTLEVLVLAVILAVCAAPETKWAWSQASTTIYGIAPGRVAIPVQVDASGIVQTNNSGLSAASVTVTNTQFGLSGVSLTGGAVNTVYSGTQTNTIGAITANTTGTASQVSVTSANGVIADNSDSLRKTILACNKDSVYNAALGLTSPVTAANALAIIPPLNCIALSTNVFTNAIYALGYSTVQSTLAFTSGH